MSIVTSLNLLTLVCSLVTMMFLIEIISMMTCMVLRWHRMQVIMDGFIVNMVIWKMSHIGCLWHYLKKIDYD